MARCIYGLVFRQGIGFLLAKCGLFFRHLKFKCRIFLQGVQSFPAKECRVFLQGFCFFPALEIHCGFRLSDWEFRQSIFVGLAYSRGPQAVTLRDDNEPVYLKLFEVVCDGIPAAIQGLRRVAMTQKQLAVVAARVLLFELNV